MPIMAAHSRSDARGTARLLATLALASIDHPKGGETEKVALNNVYRLLESFRRDVFFGREISENARGRSAAQKLTLRPPVERNVREVREALEQAVADAFKGKSKDSAIESVENVLRSIAYPKRGRRPSKAEQARTILFFRALIDHL